jgi:response regulator NasT
MIRALRIAVADDESDVRDDFRRILPRLGHQVVAVARTGRELVEQCRATRPDLVISDIKMPDLDGIEAAVAIGRDGPVSTNPAGARPRFYRKIEKLPKMPMHLLDKWRS